MKTQIVLATRNRHKLQEVRDMLQGIDLLRYSPATPLPAAPMWWKTEQHLPTMP